MKIKMAIFIICFLCGQAFHSLTAATQENHVISEWAAAPLQIDGEQTEWRQSSVLTEKKTKIQYAFMNDFDNLYILFKSGDASHLRAIQSTGLTIWLNFEANKKATTGIRFKVKPISADDMITRLEKSWGKTFFWIQVSLAGKPVEFISKIY